MGGGAAIDGHDHPRAVGAEAQKRRLAGSIALALAVGNMDPGLDADSGEKPLQQSRGGGPVHVVIAENSQPFSRCDRLGKPGGGAVHVQERRWIRQEVAHSRVEKGGHAVRIDAPSGQHAPNDLGQAVALGDGQRRAVLGQPRPPSLARKGTFDAEDRRSRILRQHGRGPSRRPDRTRSCA